jgi:hypothetical protein
LNSVSFSLKQSIESQEFIRVTRVTGVTGSPREVTGVTRVTRVTSLAENVSGQKEGK